MSLMSSFHVRRWVPSGATSAAQAPVLSYPQTHVRTYISVQWGSPSHRSDFLPSWPVHSPPQHADHSEFPSRRATLSTWLVVLDPLDVGLEHSMNPPLFVWLAACFAMCHLSGYRFPFLHLYPYGVVPRATWGVRLRNDYRFTMHLPQSSTEGIIELISAADIVKPDIECPISQSSLGSPNTSNESTARTKRASQTCKYSLNVCRMEQSSFIQSVWLKRFYVWVRWLVARTPRRLSSGK